MRLFKWNESIGVLVAHKIWQYLTRLQIQNTNNLVNIPLWCICVSYKIAKIQLYIQRSTMSQGFVRTQIFCSVYTYWFSAYTRIGRWMGHEAPHDETTRNPEGIGFSSPPDPGRIHLCPLQWWQDYVHLRDCISSSGVITGILTWNFVFWIRKLEIF